MNDQDAAVGLMVDSMRDAAYEMACHFGQASGSNHDQIDFFAFSKPHNGLGRRSLLEMVGRLHALFFQKSPVFFQNPLCPGNRPARVPL